MLYIKHKDEGCGIICHRAKVNSLIKSQTLDEAAKDAKQKNKDK